MSLLSVLVRGANTLSGVIPQRARHAAGAMIAGSSYLGWHSRRLATQHNMAQVTGLPITNPRVHRLAFASWRNYGRYTADFMHFPHLDIVDIERNLHDMSHEMAHGMAQTTRWQDYLEQILAYGKGAIISTAHFGNWDIAGALVARHIPMAAIAETFSDEQLNMLIQNQRTELGMEILPMEGSMRRILRVLQQNRPVAIVMDRPMPADQGVAISFFGRTTYVPGGPATLAVLSGAPILPGYAWYGHHSRFYMRAFPPVFPQKGANRADEITRLTQYMYDTLEEMVREWPTQWYMFRPFWPSPALDEIEHTRSRSSSVT